VRALCNDAVHLFVCLFVRLSLLSHSVSHQSASYVSSPMKNLLPPRWNFWLRKGHTRGNHKWATVVLNYFYFYTFTVKRRTYVRGLKRNQLLGIEISLQHLAKKNCVRDLLLNLFRCVKIDWSKALEWDERLVCCVIRSQVIGSGSIFVYFPVCVSRNNKFCIMYYW